MASVGEDANAEANSGPEARTETDMATPAPPPEPGVPPESGAALALHEAVGPVPLGAGWDAEPVALDWFGRRRAALLVSVGGGSKGRSAWVFRQLEPTEGLPLGYAEGIEVDGLDGLRCLCPLPNGGETRFDLVALAPDGLVYLPNAGAADAPRFAERRPLGFTASLGLGPGRVAQMTADDWDGDGQMDLLIGFNDLDGYWPAEDAALPASQWVGFNQRGGHPGYDRRGHWRGRPPRGRLFWMRNVGAPGAPRFETPQAIEAETACVEIGLHPAPLAVAWGESRGLEFLLTDATGLVRLHRNFGGQRPPVLMEPRPIKLGAQPLRLPDDRTTVLAADLDGDRKPELVFGAADGRVFAVHAGKGLDQALAPTPLLCRDRALRFGGHAVVAAADLDGDGDFDLIAGDGPGRLFLAEDLGGFRYGVPRELDALGLPYRLDPGPDGMLDGPAGPRLGFSCPAIADWDGNGRPDLIVGGAGGEVLFFHNNGSATQPRFERPAPLRCDGAPVLTPPRVRPAAASWEGADELDLITLDLQGFLCVYPRTGRLEVGEPRPLIDRLGRLIRLDGSFRQAGRCALWAGPWTGPGHLDLLVGLPRGNRHVIPAMIGRPLDQVDELPTVLLLEHLGQDIVVPRPIYLTDGRPLAVGSEGCSPCGVSWSDPRALDLVVGADDGRVFAFRRDDLRW